MKKTTALILILVSLFSLAACMPSKGESGKISIVTTIFPAYDFARAVAGDKADITMLIKPGSESHTYEPTPKEAAKIYNADLFIYTGSESENWAESLLGSIGNNNVLAMMDHTQNLREEIIEGMDDAHHHEGLDEHVWLSFTNATAIVGAICEKLCEADPENADYYRQNAESYSFKIAALKLEGEKIISEGKRDVVVFADRFPARYFAYEMGLNYFAAFPGCSEESEASAKTMTYLCDKVSKNRIPAVFYVEFSNRKTADAISEVTGAKQLLFHSCHNLSIEDFENGTTYIDIMKTNLENIKEALS